jgi:hypothetical protein
MRAPVPEHVTGPTRVPIAVVNHESEPCPTGTSGRPAHTNHPGGSSPPPVPTRPAVEFTPAPTAPSTTRPNVTDELQLTLLLHDREPE